MALLAVAAGLLVWRRRRRLAPAFPAMAGVAGFSDATGPAVGVGAIEGTAYSAESETVIADCPFAPVPVTVRATWMPAIRAIRAS